ncbi:hypothetical protein FRX31_002864 [Thalictrum thalictroides]|uniref:Uncharacterized protein n=1 Tax=Thalictrum thalictroides TaxID=46969 RepID=A0A7J6XDJ5_THATH|nr:hypothetical protein FRX31_002864 [Thalictrum thalictroides]
MVIDAYSAWKVSTMLRRSVCSAVESGLLQLGNALLTQRTKRRLDELIEPEYTHKFGSASWPGASQGTSNTFLIGWKLLPDPENEANKANELVFGHSTLYGMVP